MRRAMASGPSSLIQFSRVIIPCGGRRPAEFCLPETFNGPSDKPRTRFTALIRWDEALCLLAERRRRFSLRIVSCRGVKRHRSGCSGGWMACQCRVPTRIGCVSRHNQEIPSEKPALDGNRFQMNSQKEFPN